MQDRTTYEYAIIRIVPKVEREEFFNIGVILFSKSKKYLGIKYNIDKKRLDAFSCELDLSELNKYLISWELICKGDPLGGPISKMDQAYRFRWLTAYRNTIIQSSRTHPGLCVDPKQELDLIFEAYVSL